MCVCVCGGVGGGMPDSIQAVCRLTCALWNGAVANAQLPFFLVKKCELACKGSQFRLFANICKVLAACLIGKLF